MAQDPYNLLDTGFKVTKTRQPNAGSKKQGRRVTSYYFSSKGSNNSGIKFSKNARMQNIKAVVNRAPEVVVKISGNSKGLKTLKNHLDYISRNGKLELVDQDGNKALGRKDLNNVQEVLKASQIPHDSNKREFLHIVFSMPAKTPPNAFQKAVSDFAKEEFNDRKYFMAFHDDTDHTHMHIAVGTRDINNVAAARLSPRKADLYRWRQGFADKLRLNGIDAAASERKHRLNTRKSENSTLRQIKNNPIKHKDNKTGKVTHINRTPTVYEDLQKQIDDAIKQGERPKNPAYDKQLNNQKEMLAKWSSLADQLEKEGDTSLALQVREFVNNTDLTIVSRNQEIYDNESRNKEPEIPTEIEPEID